MSEVIISGGFDPIHQGHIELIEFARELGQVTAIVNGNEFLIRKKGYFVLDEMVRAKILSSMRCVSKVEIFKSSNQDIAKYFSQCKEKPKFFVNGGDRTPDNWDPKEVEACNRYGIKMVYFGNKISSSSDIVGELYKKLKKLEES